MTDDKEVIDLTAVRSEKRKSEIQLIIGGKSFGDPAFCDHKQFLIDPKQAQVECKDCGTLLNPMWVLERLCSEESRYKRRKKECLDVLQELRKKSKCKCKHCGKFTDIRI